MIKLTMELGGENIEVIINNDELLFFDVSTGMTTTVEGLRLSKSGCIKEFPDLDGNEDWRKETVERFKKGMKKFKTEMEKMNYIKSELTKQGYKSLFYQRAGFRPKLFRKQ